jgi:hypothetical protein
MILEVAHLHREIAPPREVSDAAHKIAIGRKKIRLSQQEEMAQDPGVRVERALQRIVRVIFRRDAVVATKAFLESLGHANGPEKATKLEVLERGRADTDTT